MSNHNGNWGVRSPETIVPKTKTATLRPHFLHMTDSLAQKQTEALFLNEDERAIVHQLIQAMDNHDKTTVQEKLGELLSKFGVDQHAAESFAKTFVSRSLPDLPWGERPIGQRVPKTSRRAPKGGILRMGDMEARQEVKALVNAADLENATQVIQEDDPTIALLMARLLVNDGAQKDPELEKLLTAVANLRTPEEEKSQLQHRIDVLGRELMRQLRQEYHQKNKGEILL